MSSKKNQNKAQLPRANKKGKGKAGQSRVVTAPVSQERILTVSRPKLTNVSTSAYADDGSVRITHREYIEDILGSVAFGVSTLSINPGLTSTFPWLSVGPAVGYESYTFEKLEFVFEPSCSTATAGRVILAVDYDPTDVQPSSKAVMCTYHNAVSGPAWAASCYSCDRKDLVKMAPQRYIRQGTILTSLNDLKTFDVGNIHVGTQGMSGTSVVGELWVEYTVVLQTPQINPNGFVGAYSARIDANTNVSRAAPWGDAGTQTIAGGLGVTASGATLTFQTVGQFLVDSLIIGTTINTTAPSTVGSTATTLALLENLYNDAAATAGSVAHIVNITVPGQTFVTDYTASAATVTDLVARIAPYAYALS